MQSSPRPSAAAAPPGAGAHPAGPAHPAAGGGSVWGWLEGAGPLPNVLLRGAGAALGRGRDPGPDLEALRLGAWSGRPGPRRACRQPCMHSCRGLRAACAWHARCSHP